MSLLFGLLALATASAFAGAAIYINVAEHPARMRLDPQAQLTQWQPSYAWALKMQVSLAIASALLALAAWSTGGTWRWALGAVAMLANLPFTMLVIMPTNHVLNATRPSDAGDATRMLLVRWARLHAVRGGLAVMATALYVWAALAVAAG